jgi:hypothetical protein
MSKLNPGGSRSKGPRVFTASGIKHAIQHVKPNHTAGAENSLADKPHSHSREVARRLRQEQRKQEKS